LKRRGKLAAGDGGGKRIFDLGRGRISQKERKGTKAEFVVARLGAGRRNEKPGKGKGRVHSGFFEGEMFALNCFELL